MPVLSEMHNDMFGKNRPPIHYWIGCITVGGEVCGNCGQLAEANEQWLRKENGQPASAEYKHLRCPAKSEPVA